MIRISLSSLALAATLALGAATPAASETLKGDNQTFCDCSNCSAEHCQPRTPSNQFTIVFVGSMTPAGTGFTTQPVAVDPNNPNVVYVGGSRR
jgi:hypothetical protein